MEDQVVVLSGVAGPVDRESRSGLVGQGCTRTIGIHISDMALFFVERELTASYSLKATRIDISVFSSEVLRRVLHDHSFGDG